MKEARKKLLGDRLLRDGSCGAIGEPKESREPMTAGKRGMKVLHTISQRRDVWGGGRDPETCAHAAGPGRTSARWSLFKLANPQIQLHESALKEGFESHLVPCRGRWIGRRLRDSEIAFVPARMWSTLTATRQTFIHTLRCAGWACRCLDLPHLV